MKAIIIGATASLAAATTTQHSAYAKVRHGAESGRMSTTNSLSLHKVQAQIQRINLAINQARKAQVKEPVDLAQSMGMQPPGSPFGMGTGLMLGQGNMGMFHPAVGSYMPQPAMGGAVPTYFPSSMPFSMPSSSMNGGGRSLGAGQVPHASYPGQMNATLGTFGNMPWGQWGDNSGIIAPHPMSSPNVDRPLYMTNQVPTYWSQPAPNSLIGSGMPSLLETQSRTKGDEGQAYWLPPASGDESAGGGGGAAPASPGTSQYSVSPQAFYQGGAGGGGAPAASFLETRIHARTKGDDGSGYYLPPGMHSKRYPPSVVKASSLLQMSTKGDEGQAYWLPPASGDESAGGGGGAAPASPGTSQYSVSPQAFYQGGAGGAPPASLLEMTARSFPNGISFAPANGKPTEMRFQQQQQPPPQQQLQQQPPQQLQPPQLQPQQPTSNSFMSSQSPPASGNNRFSTQPPPSLSDPANAFDKMHQSWIPNQPKQSMGTITASNSASMDALTGAGFMSLPDPGGSASAPQLRRL